MRSAKWPGLQSVSGKPVGPLWSRPLRMPGHSRPALLFRELLLSCIGIGCGPVQARHVPWERRILYMPQSFDLAAYRLGWAVGLVRHVALLAGLVGAHLGIPLSDALFVAFLFRLRGHFFLLPSFGSAEVLPLAVCGSRFLRLMVSR